MKLNERNIFLLDGAGAIVSAFSNGIILPMFYQWTGVAPSVSTPLALVAGVFATYSLSCFFLVKKTKPLMLLAIMIANLCYCLVSIGLLFSLKEPTLLGRAYFIFEILVVGGVVFVEARVYRQTLMRS